MKRHKRSNHTPHRTRPSRPGCNPRVPQAGSLYWVVTCRYHAMSKFGQTLFGVGGFIRWALSPFVLLFAVVMPLVIDEWTFGRAVLIGGMELMCFCLLAGFWLPPRIGFSAFRVLAGMVVFTPARSAQNYPRS